MKTNQKTNKNKLSAFIITLLIITSIAPIALSYAEPEQAVGQAEPAGTGNYPEIPGIPDDALQYNKTEITPVAEMTQVAAGEPTLFQYRNMTMLMNCSQNCEIVFTADPNVTPKILGIDVDPNQNMTLTMNMYRSPLQGEQVMERTLNFYLGIEPNAEIELKAQIRLHIDEAQLSQELNRAIDPSKLTWMYWNRTQAQWVPVDSYMNQNGYLVCNTNHFSTWTVAEIADTTEMAGIHFPLEYIYIVIAAVVVVAVAAGIVIYKKRK